MAKCTSCSGSGIGDYPWECHTCHGSGEAPREPTPAPKPGDIIIVPSRFYIDRGEDDVCGGLATVASVNEDRGTTWVYVEELPNRGYNWATIEDQAELLTKYGDQNIAHPCPDV